MIIRDFIRGLCFNILFSFARDIKNPSDAGAWRGFLLPFFDGETAENGFIWWQELSPFWQELRPS
jgi:hypothetical protein